MSRDTKDFKPPSRAVFFVSLVMAAVVVTAVIVMMVAIGMQVAPQDKGIPALHRQSCL